MSEDSMLERRGVHIREVSVFERRAVCIIREVSILERSVCIREKCLY